MKTRKWRRWIFMAVLLVGVLCLRQPVQAAESQVLGDTMRLAVKVATAPIHSEASGDSAVVKNVGFGEQLKVTEKTGNWYKVSDGYIHTSKVVLYDKNKKHIALTFDDGPSKANTKKVLAALKKYNARATFMVVGQNINSRTGDLLKQELEMGCEIGNHSYTHANFKKIGLKKVKAEIQKTDNKVNQYTGTTPTLIRAPYGAFTKSVLKSFTRPNIFWNVDTLDWKYRNSKRLINYVSKNAGDGKIVLMHDIHKTTANAADSILKNLTKKGYEMVTVTELSAIKGQKMSAGKTYASFKTKK